MEEYLIGWKPLANIPLPLYGEEIQNSKESLNLRFGLSNNHTKKLKLVFNNADVVFYRYTNESFWLCPDISNIDAQGESILKSGFLIVENSNLVQSLLEEHISSTMLKKYIHFMIIESDSYVEIVATKEPKIEWLDYVE